LGSKTPEELEAIPDIDEEIVGQIQTAIVSFYGQYESEPEGNVEAVDAEYVSEPDPGSGQVETGVLEHDLARHEAAPMNEIGEVAVIDLGQVEGLSGAPSSLHPQPEAAETVESEESATIKSAE
jgi:hypothetical protein